MSPVHCALLGQHLDRIALLDRQIEQLSQMAAAQMQPYEDVLQRLVEVPGIGAEAAQDILAEAGPEAAAFATAGQMAAWTGVCPGSQQSAGHNTSGRSPKGNPNLRRVFNQTAHAAVRTKGSYFQHLFRRLVVRLGYAKALWAVAHKLCRIVWKILREGAHYMELGDTADPRTVQRRIQHHLRMLRKLGYPLPPNPGPAPA
jgi:transposase